MHVHKSCADAFGTNAETADSKYCKSPTGGAVSRGTPDMEVVPTYEKNVRRAIRTGVSDALCSYYGDLLKETIPSRLTDLLRRLDETDKAYSEKQE
jgi:hypothetical protein